MPMFSPDGGMGEAGRKTVSPDSSIDPRDKPALPGYCMFPQILADLRKHAAI
ncbi:hypothetical protein SFHH103_03515 [Sinorhizobium fredii HH103]|uniref:Uncharacterized protein n=1 Tax=Sinorhizobium fredii (strain HH103) TaxID=1117943 RepID=G9A472_SINF1|nr:hypothetical protein SF83666_c35720 [Sinorhizobium fredii CCBAU 83666]CCE98006.1 hypothetical protein SFHH103_03515 [Sinorhizobium fredii HH103]